MSMDCRYTLKTWNGKQAPSTFYIQAKGLHAGRPLPHPIANCFAVYTADELLFSRVYSLYVGKFFTYYIGGSVVPFIRIDDVRRVIDQAMNDQQDFTKELTAIFSIDNLLMNLKHQIKHYKAMQYALSHKVNRAIVLK